jgi:hypothetical protein
VPREQVVDLSDFVVRDAGNGIGELAVRTDTVQFGGFNQSVGNRGDLGILSRRCRPHSLPTLCSADRSSTPPFRSIGYHWFIRRDGKIEAGRSKTECGAHVIGQNTEKIGIC